MDVGISAHFWDGCWIRNATFVKRLRRNRVDFKEAGTHVHPNWDPSGLYYDKKKQRARKNSRFHDTALGTILCDGFRTLARVHPWCARYPSIVDTADIIDSVSDWIL